MPKISVIIPVYNSEKFLSRCIDSVLTQTFTDLELLLIDDGSQDKSGLICDKFASQDSRIRVWHKENGGVSSARNLGLVNANGEWVTFVDSDDWLSEHFLEVLNNDINSDLIVGTMLFNKSGNIGYLSKEPVFYDYKNMRTVLENKFFNSLFNSPCSKLFRRRIIDFNKIRFDEKLVFGEDSVFVKKYLLHTSSVQTNNDMLYVYDDIGDDIYIKYSKSFQPIYDFYVEMKKICSEFEQKYDIVLSKKELVGVIYNISTVCLNKSGVKEWQYIRKFLLDKEVRQVLNERGSIHLRIILLLSYDSSGSVFYGYYKFTEYIKRWIK